MTEEERIKMLIEDLGAASEGTRTSAATALKKMGRPAVAALRKAAEDPDAERALAAREILRDLKVDDMEPDGRMKVIYHDWSRGIHFELQPGGAVTLKVPVPDEKNGKRTIKTWQATSPEDFRKKFPDVVEEYNLEPLLGGGEPQEPPPFDDEMFDKFRELVDRVTDHQLRRWRDGESRPERNGKARLGVLVGDIPAAMRVQLRLKKDEGVLVYDVLDATLAATAGLKPYDIILELDGERVGDVRSFRSAVDEAMRKEAFKLKIMREGDPLNLNLKTPESKRQ
jgi:hypothetical protein